MRGALPPVDNLRGGAVAPIRSGGGPQRQRLPRADREGGGVGEIQRWGRRRRARDGACHGAALPEVVRDLHAEPVRAVCQRGRREHDQFGAVRKERREFGGGLRERAVAVWRRHGLARKPLVRPAQVEPARGRQRPRRVKDEGSARPDVRRGVEGEGGMGDRVRGDDASKLPEPFAVGLRAGRWLELGMEGKGHAREEGGAGPECDAEVGRAEQRADRGRPHQRARAGVQHRGAGHGGGAGEGAQVDGVAEVDVHVPRVRGHAKDRAVARHEQLRDVVGGVNVGAVARDLRAEPQRVRDGVRGSEPHERQERHGLRGQGGEGADGDGCVEDTCDGLWVRGVEGGAHGGVRREDQPWGQGQGHGQALGPSKAGVGDGGRDGEGPPRDNVGALQALAPRHGDVREHRQPFERRGCDFRVRAAGPGGGEERRGDADRGGGGKRQAPPPARHEPQHDVQVQPGPRPDVAVDAGGGRRRDVAQRRTGPVCRDLQHPEAVGGGDRHPRPAPVGDGDAQHVVDRIVQCPGRRPLGLQLQPPLERRGGARGGRAGRRR